jgi:hypothetical protein
MLVSDTLLKATILAAGLFILIAVPATHVQAGYYFRYDEDVQGKIIDADTRQPIAGVVVMPCGSPSTPGSQLSRKSAITIISKY